jgi:hypothetical protein
MGIESVGESLHVVGHDYFFKIHNGVPDVDVKVVQWVFTIFKPKRHLIGWQGFQVLNKFRCGCFALDHVTDWFEIIVVDYRDAHIRPSEYRAKPSNAFAQVLLLPSLDILVSTIV